MTDPLGQYVPDEQLTHDIAPLELLKVPAAQCEHVVEPVDELKVPGTQDTHKAEEVPGVVTPLLDVPAEHLIQLAEPARL